MKLFLNLIILFLLTNKSHAQCKDVYGNDAECPTTQDSMLIYENSLKVYQFYENNNHYKKIKTTKITTLKDFKKCFYKLDSAYQAFKEIWVIRERYLKGENVNMMEKGILLPADGKNIPMNEYYDKIDDYRFYQRELECGILNIKSPFPVYDIRISPLYINVYRNLNKKSDYNGDEVEIALYIPVTVKPVALLTKDETEARTKILKGTFLSVTPKKTITTPQIDTILPNITTDSIEQKYKEELKTETKKDTIKFKAKVVKKIHKPNYFVGLSYDAEPIFVSNGVTYSIIGLKKGRTFFKIPKNLYGEYAIQAFAKIILNDDTELCKILKSKFGNYVNKIVAENYETKF
jgi:hypothetical protein